jgi:hypothetical protein
MGTISPATEMVDGAGMKHVLSGRWLFLLAQDDVTASAEALTSLGGTLVGASLEADDGLAGVQSLLIELALVLLCWLGAKVGAGPLGVLVGSAPQSIHGLGDHGDVLLLEKVSGLEHVKLRDTVGEESLLEVVDVLHELELSSRRVDLLDDPGLELVHDSAENLSITKVVVVGHPSWALFTQNSCDPGEDLSFLILVSATGSTNTRHS